ncbi:MAG TPA: alanine racemase [Candidatus Lustribacter sp.]
MIAELRIDLGAIVRNVAALAALVAPARIVPVIKSNAYGHGLVEVARALDGRVPRLAVYELGEALALRDAGITTPIHVLGPIPATALGDAHAAGIELTLWDGAAYLDDAAAAARRGGAPFRVHAKIDTGVARLGMRAADAPERLRVYAARAEFDVAGVFSHLAAAEELDSTFTHEQLAAFAGATRGIAPGVERHIAATAAAMLWPETRLDAVRTGIGIYGLWPSPETGRAMRERGFGLEPALEWRTQLVLVRDVPAHTPVGYGCAYHTKRPSRIGVLPIGYAEGLPRNAGDRGAVLIAGERCRIVGRVCMNMTFVDCTDAPGAGPGSTVTLVGRDGAAAIGADELAAATGTIAYETVSRLPAHVPRSYAVAAAS